MAKVVSIEISNAVTRVCEMDYKVKSPKVYKCFSMPTPKGAIEDGFIQENAEFALSLRHALTENRIKTKQVVFSVTSSKIVTREVVIPEIKSSQVSSYVRANANDYFPIDLSVYEIAHVVLGMEKGEGEGGKLRVMVMAAGKDLISGYAKFASSCGLKFVCVDYAGNSVYQIMRNELDSDASLVVKVEDNSTIASVIVNHNMVLQRNLAYGYERAVNALLESPELYEFNYSDAFRKMCQKHYVKVTLNERTREIERDDMPQTGELPEEARAKITGTFAQLTSNLTRMIELYNTKEPLNNIQRIVLVGMGSEILNLSKLLTNELGIPTVTVKHLNTVSGYQPMDGANYGRYVGVMGSAIAPVELVAQQSAKEKGKTKLNYGPLTVGAVVIVAGVVGGLIGVSTMKLYKEQQREADLKAKEQQYAEAEVVHEKYLAIKSLQAEVNAKYRMMEHPNDGMVNFLAELEQKLPSNVSLKSLTSSEQSAILTVKAVDIEEAAKVFQILRGFESVMDVDAGKMMQEEAVDEDGEIVGQYISFEAICYYYPIVVEETQTTVTETSAPATETAE